MKYLQTTVYPLEVQFEDVDAAGYVHHPNYLKFIERARVRDLNNISWGMDRLLKIGMCFVVADLSLRYIKPTQMRDKLFVITRTIEVKRSSMQVLQSIVKELPPDAELQKAGNEIFTIPTTIFAAQARFVFINLQTKKPTPIMPELCEALDFPKDMHLSQI